jgi:hypothetical protein
VELIEGLEETKRIATDIGQKAELARIVRMPDPTVLSIQIGNQICPMT